MLLTITLILSAVVVVLVIYALYLKFSMLTGKGRFATSIVSAIFLAIPTTIFAVGQLNFLDSIASTVSTLIGNPPLDGGWAVASKALDYFIIIVLCLVLIRALYRFGQSTIANWEGPSTSIDAELLHSGAEIELFNVAREYIALRSAGKSELPIDERSLHPTLELSDAPPNPHWDSFSRDLVLEAINEISIADNGWSTELNCWFGTLAPLDNPSSTSGVAILPVAHTLSPGQAVAALGDRAREGNYLYVCVDTDERLDSLSDIRGVKVRTISRSSLLSLGVNLRGYCEDLIERFEREKILGTSLNLSDIFVEPTLASDAGDGEISFSDLINRWSNTENRQQLSLVGEFGQGKSSAILHYCAQWAKAYLENTQIPQRVPLLIPLRGKDPSTLTRSNFLAAWGAQHRLSGRALLNLVAAGRAVLFFEGFDEVNNAGLRSQRLAQFDALWRFAFPKSKIAFTGRPNFFLDDKELRRLLRIDDMMAASGQPFATLYSFRFFDEQKIIEALRPFDSSVREGILSHYHSDSRFRDVASRPSMLPLIAITWDDIKQSLTGTVNVTSSDIIHNYIEFEYRRKEREVEDEHRQSGLTTRQNYLRVPRRVKDFYMMSIARDIQRSGRSNTIQHDELERSLHTAHQIAETFIARVDATNEELQYFKDRRNQTAEIGESQSNEIIASDVRTTGVLVRDSASGPNSYYFPHKQFYEYFIALFSYWSVHQKMSGEKRGVYWNYFTMSNPCMPLVGEPEANKFFVEMAESSWFDHVFTVKAVTASKVWVIFVATGLVWMRLYARLISADKFLDALSAMRLPKLPSFALSLVLPALVLTAAVMLLVHFPTTVAIAVAIISLSTVVGLRATVRGNSLLALLQWYSLLKGRYPDDVAAKAKKVLGPVAYRATKSIDDYVNERRIAAGLRALERSLAANSN